MNRLTDEQVEAINVQLENVVNKTAHIGLTVNNRVSLDGSFSSDELRKIVDILECAQAFEDLLGMRFTVWKACDEP